MKRSTAWCSVLASTVLLITGTFAIPASAGVPRCFGEKATIVGTSRGDVLNGTDRPDVIVGLAGSDTIRGKGKADLICAGKGNDSVHGGKGIDLTFGGGGNDEIFGDAGAFNQAVPGPGNDQVDGGPGGGDEVIYLDATGPITGDLGTGAVTGFGTDDVSNVEWLIGGPFDDSLTGSEASEVIFGADGNDTIDALGWRRCCRGRCRGRRDRWGRRASTSLANYSLPLYYGFPPPAGPITIDLPAGTLTGDGADTLVGIEGGEGSAGDDVMIGDASSQPVHVPERGERHGRRRRRRRPRRRGRRGRRLGRRCGRRCAREPGRIGGDDDRPEHPDRLAGRHAGRFRGRHRDVLRRRHHRQRWSERGPGGRRRRRPLRPGRRRRAHRRLLRVQRGGTDSADGGLGTDQCDAETEVACEADPPPPTSMAASSGGPNGFWAYALAHERVARVRF